MGGRPPPNRVWSKAETYARYGQQPHTDKLWTSLDAETFFTSRSKPVRDISLSSHGAHSLVSSRQKDTRQCDEIEACPRDDAHRPFVLSYSHFLPRQELLPERRMLILADLHKVSGSLLLEDQVRRLMPNVHVFGHTHIPMDVTIEGIRYVQWALGMPREQTGQTRVVMGFMCLYDGLEFDGEAPQHWCHWTRHYELFERDLSRQELPYYAKKFRAAMFS